MSDALPAVKRCSKCGETKPVEAFPIARDKKDGRFSQCKACCKVRDAAKRQAIHADDPTWIAANAEKKRLRDNPNGLKYCTKCGETKPVEAFSIARGKKDGRVSHCKACCKARDDAKRDVLRERDRVWRATNAKKIHDFDDVTTLKHCPKCSQDKPREAFAVDHSKKDGRHSHCKVCVNSKDMREYMRAYDRAHADEIRQRKRGYYVNNRERIREVGRAYYVANTQTILEKQHLYYLNNTDDILERGRAREKNRREERRVISQRRRARKKGNGGDFTHQELSAMRAAQNGICAYCQRQHHPQALTVDHIIPLDQGGRHEAANICLACRKCNSSKGNRTPEQWVDRWYLRDLSHVPKPRPKRKSGGSGVS